MNDLSFNSRGLGNQSTVRELRKIAKQEGPSLMFVMETKIKGKKVEAMRTTLGFVGCFAVDSDGRSGGIGLFWSDEVIVDLKNLAKRTLMYMSGGKIMICHPGGSQGFMENLEQRIDVKAGIFYVL